jgi:hypothetical protein
VDSLKALDPKRPIREADVRTAAKIKLLGVRTERLPQHCST